MPTVILLAGTSVFGQQPIASAPSQASVAHRDGGIVYVTSNSSFEYVHLFNPAKQEYADLLLQVRQRNEMNFEAEGTRGSIKVSAWRMQDNKRGERLWSFNSVGNEGLALSDMRFYRATSWPCCSAMWVNEYFSLTNGAHLYTTNGETSSDNISQDSGLVSLSGHQYKDTRFVAFGASYVKGHEQPILQYGTDSAIKQRIELRGHEYGDNFDVPVMSIVDDRGLKVTELDGDLTFTIVLRFGEAPDDQPAAELRIPVVNDRLIIEKALLPNGYSLIELQH